MRDILRKAKPQWLDDLIALNALYRPGPLRSGMVDDYIARKQGKIEVKYELPELEPILADTYGVIAYQEQVMRIAQRAGRLHAGRSRPAAQGDGEEERRGHGRTQRAQFVDGAKAQRDHREEGGEDLRPDGALRRLRLQQVAFDRLRAARLSDGLSEGQLPVALRGGAADHRGAEHRQARPVPRRVPRPRHARAAAGHQRERAARSRSTPDGRPLRADGDQERRRGRDRVALGGAPRVGPDQVRVHALRIARSAAREQARAREPRQGRCPRLAACTCRVRAGSPTSRRSARGCVRRSIAPSSTATGFSGSGSRASHRFSGGPRRGPRPGRSRSPRRRRGPRRSCWRPRRRRSDCI